MLRDVSASYDACRLCAFAAVRWRLVGVEGIFFCIIYHHTAVALVCGVGPGVRCGVANEAHISPCWGSQIGFRLVA